MPASSSTITSTRGRHRPIVVMMIHRQAALPATTRTNNEAAGRRVQPYNSQHHSILYLDPFVSDALLICLDWTTTCWRLCYGILSAPNLFLDDAKLLRLSLLVLACHHVDSMLSNAETTTMVSAGSSSPWVVPPSTWVWLALFSFSSFFCLLSTASRRHETALATALVTLFVLEAILPLFFVIFTSVLIWKQVTWTRGIAFMAVLWTIVAGLAQWIRRTVHQSMGYE